MTIGTDHRVVAEKMRNAEGNEVWMTDRPIYEIRRGDRVTFQTNGEIARVWIPDSRIFGEEFLDITQETGWAVTAVVNEDLEIAEPLTTDFSFYLVAERAMAEGGSPPKMKIEP